MKSKDIIKEVDALAVRLQAKIIERRVIEVARELGLKYTDISAWINGRRYWSMEKIISVAGKLGL